MNRFRVAEDVKKRQTAFLSRGLLRTETIEGTRIDRIALEAVMSIPLTREQRQAVQQAKEPPRFIDLESMREYILLPADLYEQMRKIAQTEVIDPSLYEFEEPTKSS